MSAVSCPKFSCLQLKSPVMIVLLWRVQIVLMIFLRWVFFSGTVDGSDLYGFGWRVDEYGMVKIGCGFCGCYCW